MAKIIHLTQDKITIVDDMDYERINRFKWFAIKLKRNTRLVWYACRTRNGRHLMMHRFILSPLPCFFIDHENGNGLDNRRSNLRVCTNMQNQHNGQIQTRRKSSQFKGVDFNSAMQKWRAHIRVNRQKKYLGAFDNEQDAAVAYNQAAKRYFGRFAKLNPV